MSQISGQDLRFKHFGANEGLSQISVLALHQDEESKLWIGTRYGLNVYDGISFQVFTNDPWDTTSLLNNKVNAIVGDSTSRSIWIGTEVGLCRYDRETGYFHRYSTSDSFPLTASISSLLLDDSHTLWITTTSGLYYLTPDTNLIRSVNTAENLDFTSTYFSSSFQDYKGNLWFGSEQGIFQHQPQHPAGQIYRKKINSNQDTLQFSHAFFEDKNQILWIGTHTHLWKYNPKTGTSNSYPNISPFDKDNKFESKKMAAGMHDNHLWVTSYLGIMVFDKEKEAFIDRIYHDPTNKYSLTDHSIHAILISDTGDRWIGTYSGGLHQYSTQHTYFDVERQIPNNANSLSSNIINGFAEGPDGKLYIATSRGGLNIYDPKTKKYTSHLPLINMRHLLFDQYGTLWIGTYFDGLIRFDVDTQKAHHYKHLHDKKNNLKNLHSRHSTFLHSDGSLWVALHKFFYLYNKATDDFEEFILPVTPHQKNIDVVSILEIDKNLWLFTSEGVHVFDPKKKSFTKSFTHDRRDKTGLPTNRLSSATIDLEDNLWVASFAGISKYDKEAQNFKTFTTKDGLASNMNLCLLADDENQLWISSSNGLTMFDQSTETFKVFDENNNLQSKAFRKGACLSCSNGELLFGGINGYNKINPRAVNKNEEQLTVRFKNFYLFDEQLMPEANSVISKKINFLDKIELAYTDRVFSIEYRAVDLSGANDLQYACYLEGFDEQWHLVGTKTTATYTNLSPGEYTFHVRVDNPQSNIKEIVSSINIVIIPPFWQTSWFKVLLLIIVLLSIFYFHGLRVRSLLTQRKNLDTQVKQRTLTIQEKNMELAIKNKNLTEAEEEVRTALEQLTTLNESLEQKVHERTNSIKEKNDKLKEYAFLNSHKVRAPLVRILGLVHLFQAKLVHTHEEDYLHDQIKISALELDEITKKINDELDESN